MTNVIHALALLLEFVKKIDILKVRTVYVTTA